MSYPLTVKRESLPLLEEQTRWYLGDLPFSARAYLIFLFQKMTPHSTIVIAEDEEQLQDFSSDLHSLNLHQELSPILTYIPHRSTKENLHQKACFYNSIFNQSPYILVTTEEILHSKFADKYRWEELILNLKKGEFISRESIINKCLNLGYHLTNQITTYGEVAFRGNLIDIFPLSSKFPLRIELFGDKIERMWWMDENQKPIEKINEISIFPTKEEENLSFFDFIPADTHLFFLKKYTEERCDTLSSFCKEIENFEGKIFKLKRRLKDWQNQGYNIYFYTRYPLLTNKWLRDFLDAPDLRCEVVNKPLKCGFQVLPNKCVFITDKEIYPLVSQRSRKIRELKRNLRLDEDSFTEIKKGDYVVHINHGIGIYQGLVQLKIEGKIQEYLEIKYAGKDRLFVPLSQIDRLQKYIGIDTQKPKIYSLGGSAWEWTKRRVKEKVKKIAEELLDLYSLRETIPGFSFSPDTPWQQELEQQFPYPETEDQKKATIEVKRDMEKPKPMDRLLCGDVGYGKTEVALRATFKAIMDGKQVAILVPTTILAQQHYNTFLERFSPYPVNLRMLSRFQPKGVQKKIISELKEGTVDLVIGTHRLIQDDVRFKNLGLVIIDEEQRFGVMQKERLKQIKKNVDVLTITATPIPRTLYLALLGIRPISMIDTAPQERLPIETHLCEYDDNLIKSVIMRELDRGGQVYFVHNRIEDIDLLYTHLQEILPYVKIAVAHGKMKEDKLAKIMLDFINKKYEVLVCTTIIESGVDIPNVNTIIVNKADEMGLAQLYQLRGRVGRANRQAYAYFLYNKHLISGSARERLMALEEFTALGSGYQLARRDLEIRGAGNLLGPEQSGFATQVGFELYCQLLEETIEELKTGVIKQKPEVVIELEGDIFIPDGLGMDPQEKFLIYRRLNRIENIEDLQKLRQRIEKEYGVLPVEANNLFLVFALKLWAKERKIESIIQKGRRIILKKIAGESKERLVINLEEDLGLEKILERIKTFRL